MPFIRVYAKPCPYCEHDVARLLSMSGGWSLQCNSDEGGCGAQSAQARSPALAIELWNGTAP